MKYEDTLLPQDVRRRHVKAVAQLSIARRVEIVSELRESVKEVARAVIAAQHPDWDEGQVEDELRRRLGRP